MVIETCAKVNLTLEVLRRRDDGFHELATIFQAVDLCDRLTLEPADELTVVVHGADLPTDQRNLCYRAASRLAEVCGRQPTVRIGLDKRLPIGAGLGGGSGNAAGVLGALDELWHAGLSQAELVALAAELGSDVAFFLAGGAALGGGRGEELTPLPVLPELAIVILGPAHPVPTGAVYGALQGFRTDAGEATRRLAEGLWQGSLPPLGEWLVNDLEEPAKTVSAALSEDAAQLEAWWPGRYRLSGSGGSWFLPVAAAEGGGILSRLVERWPGRPAWLTHPVSWGWRKVGT